MKGKDFIHYHNVKENQLLKLSRIESWKILPETVKVQNDKDLRKVAETQQKQNSQNFVITKVAMQDVLFFPKDL